MKTPAPDPVRLRKFQFSPASACLVTVVLTGTVFFFDLVTPLGVAGGVPYTLAVLVAIWSPFKRHALVTALSASALTLAGLALSPPGDRLGIFLTNRIMALCLIWIVAAIILRWSKAHKALIETHDAWIDRGKELSAINLEAARLASIVRSSADAIVGVDAGGRITSWNVGAERLYDCTSDEMVGRPLKLLLENTDSQEQVLQAMMAGTEIRDADCMYWRGDTAIPVSFSLSPILGEDGRTLGASLIARDVSERKHAEAALEAYAARLAESNEQLEQFAYLASHDLQEPLRKVSAFCELLADEYGDKLDENARSYIAYAVDGASRMRALIKDLLVLSRVESQGKRLTKVDSADAVNDALRNLSTAIQESGARISVGDLPEVFADERQLAQLFQNLIGNAIKYCGESVPTVEIHAEPAEADWKFIIRDNGIGVPAEYQERIFGIFHRLHGREEYAGTGIGLALCRRIVHRMNGKIWVESEPGRGSTFMFTAPGREWRAPVLPGRAREPVTGASSFPHARPEIVGIGGPPRSG